MGIKISVRYYPYIFRYMLPFFALFVFSVSLFPQKMEKDTILDRTVVVENEYNPEIMDASKINLLPAVEEPAIVKNDIEYSIGEMPATSFGAYVPMNSLADKPSREDAKTGFVRLGYGNYGNVDGRLSYLFNLSKKDRLGVYAALDGMNGTLKLDPPYGMNIDAKDWKSRYYSTKLKVDYTHQFEKTSLNITGSFGTDNFNYHEMPFLNPDWIYNADFNDKQHQTKAQLRAAFVSSDETLPVQFSAEGGYLSFSRKYSFGNKVSDKEQVMQVKANIWGQITNEQKVGVKLDMDNLFYTYAGLNNYTSLQMNPYYGLNGESWKLKIGAHIDLSFGKGKVIEVAPDVDIQYIFADSYVIYLRAGGGRIVNDYRQLEIGSPYWAISFPGEWKNTYMPLDATLGIKASLFPGVGFDLFGGYQIRDNDLCFTSYSEEHYSYAYSCFVPAKTKAAYAGVRLKYNYKNRFDLALGTTYYHWNSKKEEALLMKPEFEFNMKADVKVINNLYLNIGYEYITRPEVLLTGINNLLPDSPDFSSYNYEMEPINNLSLGITYTFWKELSVYAKISNILNRNYQHYYSYPAEKLNFVGGLSFRF